MGSRSLECDGVLNGELAGSRDDLRRGPGSPEEDHDDADANDRSPCADECVVRLPPSTATKSSQPAAARLGVALATLPPDHHPAAHNRQNDATHP